MFIVESTSLSLTHFPIILDLDDYNLFTFDMIFEPGTLEETFAVPILDDSVAELSENILLEIFVSKEALIQNVLPGDPIRSQVIILDDDGERICTAWTYTPSDVIPHSCIQVRTHTSTHSEIRAQ